MIEGVAGPEAASNATAMAGFIPLMTMGIPTGAAMAIILIALMMYGLQPAQHSSCDIKHLSGPLLEACT